MKPLSIFALAAVLFSCGLPAAAQTEDADPSATATPRSGDLMTGQRLIELVSRIDSDLQASANGARFKVDDYELMLVFDATANRMRLMSPIIQAEDLQPELMTRMLQANFDSALDARYAVASDIVWSIYIHPLAEITETQFASALAQVITAAATFGGSFSSGALVYGSGDSNELNEKLLRELEKRLQTEV